MTKEEVFEAIKNMTVLDIVDLVKMMEDEFGVSAAAAPVAVAGAAPAAGGDGAAPAEEKTKFTVVLKDGGDKKINVIKAVRKLVAGLGLKEAKELVEAGGKPVLTDVSKEDAENAKKELEEAGGKVELT